MQPRVQEVLAELDAGRADLEQAVEAVPFELRERRPAPERWSVAEVLEHLTLVEGQIIGVLQRLVEEARSAELGLETEASPIGPMPNLSRVQDRTRPLVASEASQPRQGLDAHAARAALARQRETLRALVIAADGLALARVSTRNPVIGELNGYHWILFVCAHEARHTAQILEIAAALRDAPDRLSDA